MINVLVTFAEGESEVVIISDVAILNAGRRLQSKAFDLSDVIELVKEKLGPRAKDAVRFDLNEDKF
jgi:hypothetical protein